MSAEGWHGIASVAYMLTRDDAYADTIEDTHLRKGATTAHALLNERFSERKVQAAVRKMLKAIADGRLPGTVYDPHMQDGPS